MYLLVCILSLALRITSPHGLIGAYQGKVDSPVIRQSVLNEWNHLINTNFPSSSSTTTTINMNHNDINTNSSLSSSGSPEIVSLSIGTFPFYFPKEVVFQFTPVLLSRVFFNHIWRKELGMEEEDSSPITKVLPKVFLELQESK